MSIVLQSDVDYQFVIGQLQTLVPNKILCVVNSERLLVFDTVSNVPSGLKLELVDTNDLTGVVTSSYRCPNNDLYSFFADLNGFITPTKKSNKNVTQLNGLVITDTVDDVVVEQPQQIISI